MSLSVWRKKNDEKKSNDDDEDSSLFSPLSVCVSERWVRCDVRCRKGNIVKKKEREKSLKVPLTNDIPFLPSPSSPHDCTDWRILPQRKCRREWDRKKVGKKSKRARSHYHPSLPVCEFFVVTTVVVTSRVRFHRFLFFVVSLWDEENEDFLARDIWENDEKRYRHLLSVYYLSRLQGCAVFTPRERPVATHSQDSIRKKEKSLTWRWSQGVEETGHFYTLPLSLDSLFQVSTFLSPPFIISWYRHNDDDDETGDRKKEADHHKHLKSLLYLLASLESLLLLFSHSNDELRRKTKNKESRMTVSLLRLIHDEDRSHPLSFSTHHHHLRLFPHSFFPLSEFWTEIHFLERGRKRGDKEQRKTH